ncbi:flagellar hook protein FlgE [Cribrihabitans marinus]|uniref:Flagellar hook protein FlgE n=1 Tax=Cribrihabitans marinus TaxID=1227549 RepID=A0A1H7DHE7_9RHOB|nr:flagellar hook-basal body complex protein [Cribrihabitans marinus]GGH39368.1 flagellar hook protein FlgE [Cribrihabitans marinus]SEK01146.1 flagellar hook protein FlgE [Cribrihabitans marinus]
MTISSSLNAGVAALSANASRLATISDNIANASTFGYKRVETDFHSMVISKSAGSYTAGGVRTTNQRLVDQRGSLVSTNNATDLAIRGRGMLPVMRSSQLAGEGGAPEMLLATTGSFRTDADGYLVTESGLALLGWPALPDGSIPNFPRDTADGLKPVQMSVNQLSGAPTTSMTLRMNLPATGTDAGAAGDTHPLSVEYYDNLGKSEKIDLELIPTVPANGTSNEWTLVMRDSASGGGIVGEYTLTFDDSRTGGGTLADVVATTGGAYDPATGSFVVNVAGGPVEVNIGQLGDSSGITQLSDTFAPVSISKDGAAVAAMTGVDVDENGNVFAVFDSGISRRMFQIPLADLPNPNGMISLDSQTYAPSRESGTFFLWNAGDGPTGEVVGFAREESTTDVATELTAMIQTQRAYSSSAKVIQTVDEMLQETTNIKR